MSFQLHFQQQQLLQPPAAPMSHASAGHCADEEYSKGKGEHSKDYLSRRN